MLVREGLATQVSLYTGMKKQLTDQGWDALHAEEIVILFVRKAMGFA